MSEEMQREDPLEQRIRTHYASEFGEPPSPDTVWTVLKEQLPSSSGETSGTPTVEWHSAPARPFPPLPTSAHHTHAFGLRSLLSIVAAVLLVALFAFVLLHPFGRTSGTTATATEPPLPAGFTVHVLAPDEVWPGISLNNLQMLSSDEGWAVGARDTSNSSESVILHYIHGKWTASRDVFPNVHLTSISMLSSTDGWASGSAMNAGSAINGGTSVTAVLLHYSGGRWISVQAPGYGEIDSLTMLSPYDGWAIQYAMPTADSPQLRTALLHYNGTAWSIADTGGMTLTGLAMLSPSEGWATGQDGVIAHFHNGAWTRWPATAPSDVFTITMVSPTDGWMSGVAPSYRTDPLHMKPHHIFMLHYNGHEWQPATLPELPNLLKVYPGATHYQTSSNTYSISAIAMASREEGWAAGTLDGGIASMLYHYSSGGWHLYPFGVNASLSTIRMVSASEGWAIATRNNFDTGIGDATILHYTNGSWTIYKP